MAANAKAATSDIEDDDAGAAPEQPKRKLFALPALPPLRWLIIGGAAFAIIALGGGAAYYGLHGAGTENKVAGVPGKPAVFVDLPEVLVNLSNPGNDRSHYLKVKIVLELPEQAMIAQIQP